MAVGFKHFDIKAMDQMPTSNIPPENMGKSDACTWVMTQASLIRQQLLMSPQEQTDLVTMKNNTDALDSRNRLLKSMLCNGTYTCSECGKKYKREGYFISHLTKQHAVEMPAISESPSEHDGNSQCVIAAFCRMALLYLDSYDAYRMADADRVFRNAKLEMLYAFSLNHTKYRTWLWRLLAYEKALLSEQEAFEYKWNICCNLQGGVGNNIPNDNAVELQVGAIKKVFQTQGPNKSFETAQVITKTNQIVDVVRKNLRKSVLSHSGSGKRPEVSKTKDVMLLVDEILTANVLGTDTKYSSFEDYRDPLARLNVNKLYTWMDQQKKIAAVKMVRNAHL